MEIFMTVCMIIAGLTLLYYIFKIGFVAVMYAIAFAFVVLILGGWYLIFSPMIYLYKRPWMLIFQLPVWVFSGVVIHLAPESTLYIIVFNALMHSLFYAIHQALAKKKTLFPPAL